MGQLRSRYYVWDDAEAKLTGEHFTFAIGSPEGLCLCSRAFRRQAAAYEIEMLPLTVR